MGVRRIHGWMERQTQHTSAQFPSRLYRTLTEGIFSALEESWQEPLPLLATKVARGSNGGEVGGESGCLASSQGPHQAGRAPAVSTAGGSWDSTQEAEAEVAGCSHNQLKLFCTQKTKQMRKEAHGSIISLFVKQGINQRLCLAFQALWIRVELTPTKQTMYY